jgi:hypothetical protein
MNNVVTTKEVMEEATEDPVGPSQTPTLVVGAKRSATFSGSTPPSKRSFCGTWWPWYIELSVVCFLCSEFPSFDWDPLLCSMSSSGRTPPSRGPDVGGY